MTEIIKVGKHEARIAVFPVCHKIKQFRYSKLETNNTNTGIIFYEFYFDRLYMCHTVASTVINMLILTLTMCLKFSVEEYLTVFI